MADRYLLESSGVDGYQKEDASGVLLLEDSPILLLLSPNRGTETAKRPPMERGAADFYINLQNTLLVSPVTLIRAPLFVSRPYPVPQRRDELPLNLRNTLFAPVVQNPFIPEDLELERPNKRVIQEEYVNLLNTALAVVVADTPFTPEDLEVRRVVKRTLQEDYVNLQNTLLGRGPFVPYIWENNRAVRQTRQDESQTNRLVLFLNTLPFSNLWEYQPRIKKSLASEEYQNLQSTLLAVVAVTTPFITQDWNQYKSVKYTIQEQPLNLANTLLYTAPAPAGDVVPYTGFHSNMGSMMNRRR